MYKLVLFNLLQNAVKFNKPSFGDVVITVEIRQSKEPSHKRERQQVFILETHVIDTGNEGIE